jgi:hypothetical protein
MPIPTSRGASSTQPGPFVLEGVGEVAVIDLGALEHRVLLLFASTNCDGCADLLTWPRTPLSFGLDADDTVMVVVRTAAEREALGAGIWASAAAFDECRVSGAPFFVLLDPAYDSVATEGVVWGLDSVTTAISTALAGTPQVEVVRLDPPR